MAWDFETDPEFQEKLDWMDRFVRDEVEALDLVFRGPADPFDPARRGPRARDGAAHGDRASPGPVGLPPGSRARSITWRTATTTLRARDRAAGDVERGEVPDLALSRR